MIMEASLYTNIFIALLFGVQTASLILMYILSRKVAGLEERELLDILRKLEVAEEVPVVRVDEIR